MPEAKCYPGKSWDGPAIAGLPVTIYLPEEKLLEEGGFGWSGSAWLECPMDETHRAPIEAQVYEADASGVATWTPAAVIGRLPASAPCMDRCEPGSYTWRIRVEPKISAALSHWMPAASSEPFVIEDVHIVGLPGSSGFPPVGHH